MGGKPSKGTARDMRLKANNPAVARKTTPAKSQPFGGKKASPFTKK